MHQLYEKGPDPKFRTVILSDLKLSGIILLVLDINLTVCAYISSDNQVLGCTRKVMMKGYTISIKRRFQEGSSNHTLGAEMLKKTSSVILQEREKESK